MKSIAKKILAAVLVLSSLVGFSASVASFATEDEMCDKGLKVFTAPTREYGNFVIFQLGENEVEIPIYYFESSKPAVTDDENRAWVIVEGGDEFIPGVFGYLPLLVVYEGNLYKMGKDANGKICYNCLGNFENYITKLKLKPFNMDEIFRYSFEK